VILLLDDRFLKPDYQELFPREWSEYGVVNRQTVSGWLERFWIGKSQEANFGMRNISITP